MEAIKLPTPLWTVREIELLHKWQHLSTHIIAKRLGRTRRSVVNKRLKLGLSKCKPRGRHTTPSPEQKAIIRQLRQQGTPQMQIAKEVGCTQWTVSKILREAV